MIIIIVDMKTQRKDMKEGRNEDEMGSIRQQLYF